MRLTVILAAFLLCHGLAAAGPCKVPAFEEFVPGKQDSPADGLQVQMRSVAQLSVPSGFSRVSALPSGIAFGQHPRGIAGLIDFETQAFVSIHKKGAKPAQFFLSIFRGLDATGCEYLRAHDLESEDYRLHATVAGGAELFAFGKGDRHKFHLIRLAKPDFVLTGLFQKISRAEFETILSTLAVK